MIKVGSGGKRHIRLLMVALMVLLLGLGATSPLVAQGTGAIVKVTGSKANEGLVAQSTKKKTGQTGKSSKKTKKGTKKSTKKAKGQKNQAAARLDQLAKLPWPENVSQLAGIGAVLVLDNYTDL
jgi:hypothetical protein